VTGAIVLAAVIGLASLLAGVALGWYLRRTNDWCSHCGEQLSCEGCGSKAGWPKRRETENLLTAPR
jgi:hypothetical protein